MFIYWTLFNLITNLIHCIISFCVSSVLYLFLYNSMYFSMSVWSLLPVDAALAGIQDMRHWQHIGAFGGSGSCRLCGRLAIIPLRKSVQIRGEWYHKACIRAFVRMIQSSWARCAPHRFQAVRATLREYFEIGSTPDNPKILSESE